MTTRNTAKKKLIGVINKLKKIITVKIETKQKL